MRKRISDLLDPVTAADVQLKAEMPLSSERIKELTMKQVNKTNQRRRLGFRLLVIAAVVAMLSVTAYAAEEIFHAGDIIRSLFQKNITEEQAEVINSLGGTFQPCTQTSEGTTVTLAAAYGDEYLLHLYFQVEAPEGAVLPDGISYSFCDWNAIDYSDPDCWEELEPGEGAPYDSISRTVEIAPLEDADPHDNRKDFHVIIHGQPGTECKFNDGYSKYFNMTGIYEQIPDASDDDDAYVPIAQGVFSFDVGLVNKVEHIDLEVEGLKYGGHKVRTWTHDSPCIPSCEENLTGEYDVQTGLPIHSEEWDYEVTVRSVRISPLGADWKLSYTTNDETRSFGLAFKVVLKDGSEVKELIGGFGNAYSETTSGGTTYFTEPIDLSQVDHIVIGDEEIGSTHIVYLPEIQQ